jgi:hypothetical protein
MDPLANFVQWRPYRAVVHEKGRSLAAPPSPNQASSEQTYSAATFGA